jgi:polar amino acid transport system substrate-binding protein
LDRKVISLIIAASSAALLSSCVASQAQAPQEVQAQLAPTGILRVGLNTSVTMLVVRDEQSGALRGVAIDIPHELADRVGIPLRFVTYATGGSAAAIDKNEWDIAFFAVEPARAAQLDFSAQYAEIDS